MYPSLLTKAAAITLVATISACSVVGGEAAPEPAFETVEEVGAFQIRDYPRLIVAKTAVNGSDNTGFRTLFRYISGANAAKRDIAMTAPVVETSGTEIAMTAPVLMDGEGRGSREMAFILPDKFTAETAPAPTDPAVRLEIVEPRRLAVIRFNGRADQNDFARETRKLEAWIADRGLRIVGFPEQAQYNPPWTLPAMRRNEVLIPVAQK